MSWRKAVNRGLERATGLRIVRVGAEPARPAAPPKPTPKLRRRPVKSDRIKRYHDPEARATMKAVRPWTMTS